MRVFRTTYRDGKGKTRQAAKWYVEFIDHRETVRRLPAFSSKAASEEMGRNVEKLVGYFRATGGQTDPRLTRWLSELPQRTRDKLVSIGLLDAERVAAKKPLSEHLDDFRAALTAKGCTAKQVQQVSGRVQRVFDGCGFKHYGDIGASKVMAHLDGLRRDTEKKRGMSAQTFNFYLGAVKQFCRWMVKDRRASESPVAHLDGLNVKTDRRHDRRALTVDELCRLLEAAHDGPEQYGMTGTERELLYRLAVESGLRAGELRSLTRASFDLDGDPPTVTVGAAYSKRRREDMLPLRPELAGELEAFVATLAPAAQVFRAPEASDVVKMLRSDLSAAGIPYRDDAGRVADFHSLRHSFLTNLADGGVHPKTAQTLARHSTITLTMDRYTHSYQGEHSAALAVLPDLSRPSRQAARATGTDDARAGQKNLADYLAPNEQRGSVLVGAGRRTDLISHTCAAHEKPRKTREKYGFCGANGEGGIRTRETGINPSDGLANRWFQPLTHLSKLMFPKCFLKLRACDLLQVETLGSIER